MNEPRIIINNQHMEAAHVMTIRVALESFAMMISDSEEEIYKLYLKRIEEIRKVMYKK